MADAMLEAVITADVTGFTGGLSKAQQAMRAFQGALGALGVGGLFTKMIKESSEGESAIRQLDAALKSTSGGLTEATAKAGHWATVTRKSGEHVDAWEKSLKAANATMAKLSAKQAAGIALSGAEHKAYAAAAAAAQQYAGALAGATSKQKVWVDGQSQVVGVSHMTREAMIDMGRELENVTRFTDDQIISTEAMLLTFTKVGKDIFPQATEAVLDMSQAMGQDWKNSAIQIGKALNDPINGMTALRRVGVTFTAEQEKMIRSLVRQGKLLDAQKVILKELQTEFGGSARAAGETLAGQFDILGHKVDRLLGNMGDALAPVLKGVAGVFGQVVDAMEPFAPVLAAIAVGMGAIVLASSPLIAGLLAAAAPIALVIGAVGGLALAFEKNFLGVRDIVMGVVTPIRGAIAQIQDMITNFVTEVTAPEQHVAPLSDFVTVEGPGEFKGGADAAARRGLGQRIADSLGIDPKMMSDLKKTIDDTLKPIGDGIQGFIKNLSGADMSGVETVLKGLVLAVGTLAAGIAAIGIGTLKGIGDALPPLGTALKSFIDMLAMAAKGDLSGAVGKLGEGIGKLAEGLLKIPLNIAQELGKLLNIDIAGGLKSWEGVFDNLGKIINTLFGPDGSISKAIQGFNLQSEIERIVGAAVDWLAGAGKTLWDNTFGKLVEGASKILSGLGAAIVGAVKGGLIEVLKALKSLSFIPGMPGIAAGVDAAINAMGKASGGPVMGGTPYMVGEQGRELFVPSTSGRIVPNGALGGGSGNGSISIQNVTVYGVSNVDELYAQIRAKAKSMNRPLAGAM